VVGGNSQVDFPGVWVTVKNVLRRWRQDEKNDSYEEDLDLEIVAEEKKNEAVAASETGGNEPGREENVVDVSDDDEIDDGCIDPVSML